MILDPGRRIRPNSRGRKEADYTSRTCAGNIQSRIRKQGHPYNRIGYHKESNTHSGNRTHSNHCMRLALPRSRPSLRELPVCFS